MITCQNAVARAIIAMTCQNLPQQWSMFCRVALQKQVLPRFSNPDGILSIRSLIQAWESFR